MGEHDYSRMAPDRVIAHLIPVRAAAVLFGVVAFAWAVSIERMQGMDAGPGTELGGLGWYLGIWLTMTAAMMLPSEAPAALVLARLRRGLPTLLFLTAYLAVWTAYGLAAYALLRLVTVFDTGRLAWNEGGPYLAGGVVAAAGLYELTPLKQLSLRRCRRLHPDAPAFRSGLADGLHCVGCSGGLMAVLFALGVMSVFWMVVVAGVIFAEKVLPHGPRLTRPVALALLALGIWVAFSPATVPGLTEPGMSPSMEVQP
jgi:predicted metal-binding membrane protein